MSVIVANPSDISVKQVIADENPYEPAPFLTEAEAVEMRNHPKFSPLPQEPPPAPERRHKMEEETNIDMSTGQSSKFRFLCLM